MYSDIGLTRQPFKTSGPSWAGEWPVDAAPITLDTAALLAKYTDGNVPSGAVLAMNSTTKRYGPYGGTTEEVQTLTEGGSGLTSYTITYAGQTTASIDDDATASQVQAALEALSNIAPGDVTVTGGPLASGPFTLTFGGTLANTNVAAVTTTPTGGTGTVDVATTTAGGAEGGSGGLETAKGLLVGSCVVRSGGGNVPGALYYKGRVYEDLLPANSGLDPAAKAELTQIYFDRVGA